MINLGKNKEIGTQKADKSKVNPFVSQLDKCHTRQIQKKRGVYKLQTPKSTMPTLET